MAARHGLLRHGVAAVPAESFFAQPPAGVGGLLGQRDTTGNAQARAVTDKTASTVQLLAWATLAARRATREGAADAEDTVETVVTADMGRLKR